MNVHIYMDVRTAHIRTLRRGRMVRDANVYGESADSVNPRSGFLGD